MEYQQKVVCHRKKHCGKILLDAIAKPMSNAIQKYDIILLFSTSYIINLNDVTFVASIKIGSLYGISQ